MIGVVLVSVIVDNSPFATCAFIVVDDEFDAATIIE